VDAVPHVAAVAARAIKSGKEAAPIIIIILVFGQWAGQRTLINSEFTSRSKSHQLRWVLYMLAWSMEYPVLGANQIMLMLVAKFLSVFDKKKSFCMSQVFSPFF